MTGAGWIRRLGVTGAAVSVLLAAPVTAHDGKSHEPTAETALLTPVEVKAQDYFTDTVVVDHEGRKRRFFSDLLRGRTVAVTMFYTECLGGCPIMNNMMSVAQEELGGRMGQDIFFVSLTVDPKADTPMKLAEYRKQFDAGEGWTFVSGTPEAIETVNRKLGNVADREEHLTAVLIGNPSEGRWRKLAPNVGPDIIAAVLKDFADGVHDNEYSN